MNNGVIFLDFKAFDMIVEKLSPALLAQEFEAP